MTKVKVFKWTPDEYVELMVFGCRYKWMAKIVQNFFIVVGYEHVTIEYA